MSVAKPTAPTALTVRQTNCSMASLSWEPASDLKGTILEYELAVQPTASDTVSMSSLEPFTIGGLHHAQHTVVGLESSTDYSLRVRARTSAGWSSMSREAVLRTGPPDRVLPAPNAPEIGPKSIDCATVELRLPAPRRSCTRDTALLLEYREYGGDVWHQYADGSGESVGSSKSAPVSLLVSLPREHSRTSVDFRLRAQRGPILSEPSAVVGPIQTCESKPVHSLRTVFVAVSIALALIFTAFCVVHVRAGASGDGFSKERPPKKEHGMTQLNTADEDDPLNASDDELSVYYKLGDGPPLHGMLPLAGISNSADLLRELAEFGCELQDDVILSISTTDVEYTDHLGKTKVLGPFTPFADVTNAGEVTVRFSKAGLRTSMHQAGPDLMDSRGLGKEQPRRLAVAVTRAPQPTRAAP